MRYIFIQNINANNYREQWKSRKYSYENKNKVLNDLLGNENPMDENKFKSDKKI